MLQRPPLYARALNAAGAWLQPTGWLAGLELAPEALLRAARKRARVHEDDDLEDPDAAAAAAALARLAQATETQAQLTLTGRIAIRKYLVDLLVNRLLLQRDRSRDPGIDAQRIGRPVFILGLPRTGTTLLHNLIAQDPAVRVPRTWEVMFPSPPPRPGTRAEPRVARCARALRWVERLAPDFRRIHALGAELPQECIAITTHAFASIQFHTTQRVPAYEDWLEQNSQLPAYRFHRRFLQHLQSGECCRRWILKAPGHLFGLDALLAVYPDACIVQTHRDPLQVVGSIASHGVVLRAAFSDAVEPAEVARDWSVRWARALAHALRARDADAHAGTRFLDLHYESLVRDPLAAVRAVYAHAQIELGAPALARMRAFLAANPQHRHGRHHYTLESFGLQRDEEAARYARYCRRFAIAAEGARLLPDRA